jgi:pseudaminic acid synthase
MKLAERIINQTQPPFIIAEMSGNHNRSLERAMEIVEAAGKAGAHALKLQTYTADTITLSGVDGDFLIDDKQSPWCGESLHDLYSKAHTPWDWHEPIMNRAQELGMICFSSPFDETAVDFLEDLHVPAYKIASFENNHIPLIQKVAATGKPLIISTGMASEEEIDEAVNAARSAGCTELSLLKCTSTYPASPENSNVLTIPYLRERYECEVGLSDHTMGVGTALTAVAHGATVIEKHLTICREDGGVDSTFSMEPDEFRRLVEESKRAWQSLGNVYVGPTEAEQASLQFRRSLYVSQNMKCGEVFNVENLRIVRPGNGLAPKHISEILGKQITKDSLKGTPVSWDLVQ